VSETETSSETVEHEHELWRWGGVRLAENESLRYCWIGPDGSEWTFAKSKLAGSVIGGTYRAEIVRKPDGGVSLFGKPVYVGDPDDDDEQHDRRLRWCAADKIARSRNARMRAEANAAKRDALDDALTPVVMIASSLRTNAERDAFAAYVLRVIRTRGWG
jgi:hypothetical protein